MTYRASVSTRRHLFDAPVVAATSSSSITLLPFLYQTHSILRTSILNVSRKGSTVPENSHARCLHSSSRRHSPRQPSSETEEDEWGPVPKEYSRHVSSRRRTHKSSRYGDGDIEQPRLRHAQDRFRHQRMRDVPFEHLGVPSSNPDPGQPIDQSTLTDNERKAFYRLFRSLAPPIEEIQASTGQDRYTPSYDSVDYLGERDGFEGEYDSSGLLERILTGDATELGEHANSVTLYPPALRNMAQQAEARMRLHQRSKSILQAQDDNTEADPGASHPAILKERQEAKRIETAMRAAETDQALWAILEKEVFSNIRLIQAEEDRMAGEEAAQREAEHEREEIERSKLHDAQHAVKREIAARGRKEELREDTDVDLDEPAIQILDTNPPTSSPTTAFTPEALATMISPSSSAPTTAPVTEPLFTHHPAIYAHLTALALTLLTKRTAYTPLALSLLPAIQRIGLTAYALCASTALYNTLLAYQYRVFHASHAMLATLAEMDGAGVPMDADTLAIVKSVRDYRSAARSGRLGVMARTVEQLWSRAEEGKALDAWARRIEARLERRAVEGVQRRKVMGELRGEGAIG